MHIPDAVNELRKKVDLTHVADLAETESESCWVLWRLVGASHLLFDHHRRCQCTRLYHNMADMARFSVCFGPHLSCMMKIRSGYLKCQWHFGSCSQTTHHDANNLTLRQYFYFGVPLKYLIPLTYAGSDQKFQTRLLGFFLFNILIDILLLSLLLLATLILNIYVVKKEKDFQY